MDDKELIERAAKAAGIAGIYVEYYDGDYYYKGHHTGILIRDADGNDCVWNPIEGDSDALRLAFDLKIDIVHIRKIRKEIPGLRGLRNAVRAIARKPDGKIIEIVETRYKSGEEGQREFRRAIVIAAAANQ